MEETYNAPRQGGGGKVQRGFWTELKNFDLYHKVDEEFRVQTAFGATLSVVGWVIIVILLMAEIQTYVAPEIKEHLVVDTSLGQKLRVNFNITFHALTCAEAHLDAMVCSNSVMMYMHYEMFSLLACCRMLLGTTSSIWSTTC